MPCIARLYSVIGPAPGDGMYLARFDPEAHDGVGEVLVTPIRAHALRFDSARDAFNTWRTVPRNRAWRPDGKPNRPLTAYTMELEPDDDTSNRGSDNGE